MKITLIFPRLADQVIRSDDDWWASGAFKRIIGLGRTNLTPPLSLLALAGATPPDVEVKIVDERLEEIPFDEPVDLVGITTVTPTAPRTYQIADAYRKRGVRVVLGGIHPTVLPREAIQHSDAVVIGEGEPVWPRVVTDFREGRLLPFYKGSRVQDLDDLPRPRRDLIPGDRYLTLKALTASRGCPNGCIFCSAHHAVGKRYRTRSVASIVAELGEVPGRFAFFLDDNIAWESSHAKSLFRSLIPLRIKWVGEMSLSGLEDPGLLELAAESGCVALGLGFESLSPQVIRSVRKNQTNDPSRYRAIIRRVHEHGIAVMGHFVLGFDEDDTDVFPRLVDFIGETSVDIPAVTTLVPYPGTPIFRQFEREGRLLHKDWAQYDCGSGVVFRPKRMSPGQLQEGCLKVWDEVSSPWHVTRRLVGAGVVSLALPFIVHLAVSQRRTLASARARPPVREALLNS